MNINNVKIKTRLVVAFTLLIVFSIGLGVFSIIQLGNVNNNVETITGERMPTLLSAKDFNREFFRVRIHTERIMNESSSDKRFEISKRLTEAKSNLDSYRNKIEQSLKNAEAINIFQRIKAQEVDYWAVQSKLVDDAIKGRQAADQSQLKEQLEQLTSQITASISQLVIQEESLIDIASKDAEDTYAMAIRGVITAISATVILAIFMAVFITLSLVVPIKKAVDIIGFISKGDLTKKIIPEGKDEIYELMLAMKTMQDSLRKIIGTITDSSLQLSSTATELSGVTEDTARTLHQQNSELEQAATAVTQMSSAIEDVSRNAADTYSASVSMSEKTSFGNEQVHRTVNAVEGLSSQIERTKEHLADLGSKISSIGSVLNVIEKIAEQTNLLALNAAIEAARAGSAGRGFSVVADEVTALARRTQDSTKQISTIIAAIQNEMKASLNSMLESHAQSKEVVSIARSAGEALSEISSSVHQINEWNSSIASAAEEQSQVTQNVDKNLLNIRDFSVQTSAGATQLNTSTQDLAKLASELSELVSMFNLDLAHQRGEVG